MRTLLALFGLPLICAAQSPLPSAIYRSVVRIEVAIQVPDYGTPWNSGQFGGGIGTGFLVGENQILTNAHVISNAKRILITTNENSTKYPARVDFVAHDCDLALLSVDDFSDFAKYPRFTFGEVPELESQVRVIGYPIGGDRLSVTRGIVSRIDYSAYSHTMSDQHLVLQIDAAINPGNSGGPVLMGDKVVGVAFQGLREADNTGYVIPTPVIRRFLKDISDGSYDHYVDLAMGTFPLFNPAMRQALNLPPSDAGVLVSSVVAGGSCDGVLKPGDILFAIDGNPIDSAGQITIDGASIDLNEIVERKFVGDVVQLRFLSAGTWHDQDVTLKTLPQNAMYSIQYDKRPRYIVFAGLLFQPLDTNLYSTYKFSDYHVRKFYQDYLPEGLFKEREDVVVLTRLQDDPINTRLDEFAGMVVDKINGVTVRSLKQADELLHTAPASDFVEIELLGAARPIVLPAGDIPAANERIQRVYGIDNLSNLED